MKPLVPFVLVAFSLCLSRGQAFTLNGVEAERVESYDGTLIGTVVGGPSVRSLANPRPNVPYPDRFMVQRVRIQDSRAFPSETIVEVYFPCGPQNESSDGASTTGLPLGMHVLVIGKASRDPGVLRIPDQKSYPDQLVKTDSSFPSSLALAYFETRQERLAPVSDPLWRMLSSVAEAFVHASDANAVLISQFLENITSPDWKTGEGAARMDDRLSRLFADAASKEGPYHRALIAYALNRLFYVGYGDQYYRDVYDSASDPGAFPNGVPVLHYWERPENLEIGVPRTFRHSPQPTLVEYVSFLKRAKSPSVSVWLLKDLSKPPETDVRALLRFLDSSDPNLRYAYVERLANWYGEPVPEKPREVFDSVNASHFEYPGLDAAVTNWKSRLAGH